MATIVTQVKKGSTIYSDVENVKVRKTVGANNSVGTFEFTIENTNGLNKDTFSINDEITINAFLEGSYFPMAFSFSFTSISEIMGGVITEIDFNGEGSNKESLTVKGEDFMLLLKNTKIEPTSYSNQTITQIVTDIMTNELPEVTLTNLETITTNVVHKRYNHDSVFDALKELAGIDYFFYIDSSKDLHFKTKDSISSGLTLDKTNITKARFRTIEREMSNKVWVYGSRILTGWNDTFTANGGSVYTLDYPPHNTTVFVGGSTTPKVGGILNLQVGDVGSPTQYLVDFDNQNIVFVSGTDAGDNIPTSGADSISIDYQRNKQIVKYGQDDSSIANYGQKEKIIVDKGITDPRQAKAVVINELNDNSSPIVQGNISVNNILSVTPGNTINVNIPNHNQENVEYQILEATYDFTPSKVRSGNYLTLSLNKRILDISDTIKNLMLDIKKIQSEDIINSEIATRLLFATGSFGFRVNSWNVKTRNIGNSFVLGHSVNGVLGSPAVGISGGQLVLGSATAGAYTIQRSGGQA